MTLTARVVILAAFAGIGALWAGGCTSNLFVDSDPYTKSRIDRYYDHDSAVETSESRKQSNPMGFGAPGGAAYQ